MNFKLKTDNNQYNKRYIEFENQINDLQHHVNIEQNEKNLLSEK